MKTKIHANIGIATDFHKFNYAYFSTIHPFMAFFDSFA